MAPQKWIEIKRSGENNEILEVHLPNGIIRAQVPSSGQTILCPFQDAGIVDLGIKPKQIVKVKDENGIVVFEYGPVGEIEKGNLVPSTPQAAGASTNLEEEEDIRNNSGRAMAERMNEDDANELREKMR
ncbi:MAG: hypothetical protein Q9183_005893, partial [Haloplaca sp. 2 TL-2023]